MEPRRGRPPDIARMLDSGEVIEHHVETIEMVMAVTDRRIIVQDDHRVALDLPFDGLRRIQLDVERDRPSTLVLVPDQPLNPPQVLTVTSQSLHEVASAVATIGVRLEGQAPPV